MRDASKIGLKRFAAALGALALAAALIAGPAFLVEHGAFAQTEGRDIAEPSPLAGNVPGGHLGAASDSQIWRALRGGAYGTVSIPDKQAGQMIQSEGDNWRARRNYFAHWLSATSFIALALTGLNMLYGKHVLLPILGPEAFSALAQAGKYVHNYLSFAFMSGVVLMFVIWVRHNLPTKYDLQWLAKGGGLFTTGVHAPSEKFNAGQKIQFWLIVIGGVSLSLTGLALLIPFTFSMFEPTFAVLNVFGLGLPTDLTPMDEMQLSHLWHAIVALTLITVMIGHIYIGSLGMEGAFAAMGTGQVDQNWARQHHSLWVEEAKGAVPDAVPAE